jgi:hypothetical protein
VSSDNPRGDADDQQERLEELRGWVIGFVDGEGCFSISFVRQNGGQGRSAYRLGYQVAHRFVVTQGAGSIDCLQFLQEYFGVGRVYVQRRSDPRREQMAQFIVDNRWDLLEEVIPLFERYPLRTSKRTDFEKFTRVVRMVAEDRHLSSDGMREILSIAETMNRRKPRPEVSRILRGHTPNIRDTG